MSPSSQSELSTDAYSMTPQTATSAKSGLNNNQKKALGLSAAALLLGGGALAISHRITQKQDEPVNGTITPAAAEAIVVTPPDDIDVAGKVTSDMSFAQAFSAAREEVGMGGVFSWHGHWYNTFEKEEWAGLSLQQRQEYTEHITGEKLPVMAYHRPTTTGEIAEPAEQREEPTIIEGHLNGQRVMGLDYDHDGVIDVLVMDGADGQTYRVVDTVGDDGLDTIYQYNSLTGQMTGAVLLDHPVVLSNDQFSEGLEESMSREVVDSILNTDATAPLPAEFDGQTDVDATADVDDDDDDADETVMLADDNHEADDTYVNDGDVQDMDE